MAGLRRTINYLGQLRAYSYVDLLLLCAALTATPADKLVVSLLWFGFLIHLEWRHRDRGRERWHPVIWVALWVVALLLNPAWETVGFIGLAAAYSLKKRVPFIGLVSSLVNGGVKALLILQITSAWRIALGVWVVMSVRNFVGDIRDAGKDADEGVRTLPVVLGLRVNVPLVYPLCLFATSALWAWYGSLGLLTLTLAWLVEAVTYRRTPR